MKVEIPQLPPKELSPNGRYHWAVKARATRVLREAAFYCAMTNTSRPQYHEAEVSITIVVPDRRHMRDTDNVLASLKPAIDGCVDAGIIPDDSPPHLYYRLPVVWEIDKERAPLIILEFSEV